MCIVCIIINLLFGVAMLRIAHSMSQFRFSELMTVYHEGNLENGVDRYPYLTVNEQLRYAEQDFYNYLSSVFFLQRASLYAIWEIDGAYKSALRLEPYSDGMLLCALETAPEARGKGYATELISAIQRYLRKQGSGKVYSHVSKRNAASLAVHKKCGFQIIKDSAVYSDGSVMHNSYTLTYRYEKSEI